MRRVVVPLLICLLFLVSVRPAPAQEERRPEGSPLVNGPSARRILSSDGTVNMIPTVSFSPDGRRVAYVTELDGGVYARDLSAGTVLAISGGITSGWCYHPVWSPDGRQLAFSAEDPDRGGMSLFVVDVATAEARPVPGATVEGWIDVEEWSMDGQSLLVNLDAETLALIDLSQGSLQTLVDSASSGHGSLSPDGRFVTYAAGADEETQIFVQEVGGGRRQISWVPGRNETPLWAPDGNAIAFLNRAGIWVVPMTGGVPAGDARLGVSASGITLLNWTAEGLFYGQSTQVGLRGVPYQISVDPNTGTPDPAGLQLLPGFRPDSVSVFGWSGDMSHVALGHRLSPTITITSVDPPTVVIRDLGRYGHPRRFHWVGNGPEVRYEPDVAFWPGMGSTVLSLDVTTGRVREMFPRIQGAGWFSFSDDGRTMSFYRRGAADVPFAPVWPSAGAMIAAVVVSPTGKAEGTVVATAGEADEVPFSNGLRPMLTRQGDRVLFVRQAIIDDADLPSPSGSSLWVVGSDARGARKLASGAFIQSAIWDPSGRFIAYTAKPVRANDGTIARVIDVTAGAEKEIPLPGPLGRQFGLFSFVRAVDWSMDGTRIGFVVGVDMDPPWECWVVVGLH